MAAWLKEVLITEGQTTIFATDSQNNPYER